MESYFRCYFKHW